MVREKEAAEKPLTLHLLLLWLSGKVAHKVFMDPAAVLTLQTRSARAGWHRCMLGALQSSERGHGKGMLLCARFGCVGFLQHPSSTVEIPPPRPRPHGTSPQTSLMRRLEVSLLQAQCCWVGKGC